MAETVQARVFILPAIISKQINKSQLYKQISTIPILSPATSDSDINYIDNVVNKYVKTLTDIKRGDLISIYEDRDENNSEMYIYDGERSQPLHKSKSQMCELPKEFSYPEFDLNFWNGKFASDTVRWILAPNIKKKLNENLKLVKIDDKKIQKYLGIKKGKYMCCIVNNYTLICTYKTSKNEIYPYAKDSANTVYDIIMNLDESKKYRITINSHMPGFGVLVIVKNSKVKKQ